MKEIQNEQIDASVVPHEVYNPKAANYWISLTRVTESDLSVKAAPYVDYDEWREEMNRVHCELERVKALNAPTAAVNCKTTKANKNQPGGSIHNGLIPLPFHPEKWINPFILREEHHSAALTDKRPEHWARDIAAIEDPILRAAIARIVWWDYFARRSVSKRWPHLDRHLEGEHVKLDKEILKRGLFRAGYSPWHAHRRLDHVFDYNREGRPSERGKHSKRRCKVNNIYHDCKKK